ncbi:TRAP transporter substrate-binding protein DctP [Aquisalibacillus elongatus]|uniref:Tripartite ATP-independent transporter DctP family solute receptor n=1 Tax=Aquisalibacillus elongatus TaxID=485577 RepID=A0A3N5C3J6_9BACI|nr:TRAP transporter substrate-binding protein DctP [Aquisalibacillus elongatus]RPF54042.1 tripartite ATP-independent transporter DctP family solute receptor [Aquisalibacillus elongatus]
MLTTLLTLGLILAACGGSDDDGDSSNGDSEFEEQTWAFITEEQEGQVQYVYAEEFAKRIDEKTDGAITVEPYEFGGLGTETDQVEQLQNGTAQLAVTSPGFIGNTVKESQIFGLHFLFPDSVEKTHEILTNSEAINEDLVKKYEEIGIEPLAFWTEGGMQWTSDRPIEKPSDFEGFKMRIQGSKLQEESYKRYDADPTSMSWGELYTGLENGTVQGQENPIFFIADASFHEVQDYMTISNHNNYVATTTVNSEWYNGLNDAEKELVDETVEELQGWVFEEQKRQNDEFLSVIEDSEEYPTEVIRLTEEQRAEFQKLAEPARDFYRDEVSTEGGAILDKLEKEIEEATSE